uniref:Uncharacterized protein n=1 Tax=Salix viminalis TaxID=40686 RepID=A0A6N2N582_SALVM
MDSGLEASAQSHSFYLCSLRKTEKEKEKLLLQLYTSDKSNYHDYPRRLLGTCVTWKRRKDSFYSLMLARLPIPAVFSANSTQWADFGGISTGQVDAICDEEYC